MPSDWNAPLAPYVIRSTTTKTGLSFETLDDAIDFITTHIPHDRTAHVTCFGEVVWPERDDLLAPNYGEEDEA